MLFEKWIVSLFISQVSEIIRKVFVLRTFLTLVTQMSRGKGYFVFFRQRYTGPKWIISFTLNTIHFMDIEIVPIIKKSWFFYLYFFSLLFTSSYSLTVYIHSVYMALETELYFPDSFLLLSLKIKRPLLAGCSNHHAYYFKKTAWKC